METILASLSQKNHSISKNPIQNIENIQKQKKQFKIHQNLSQQNQKQGQIFKYPMDMLKTLKTQNYQQNQLNCLQQKTQKIRQDKYSGKTNKKNKQTNIFKNKKLKKRNLTQSLYYCQPLQSQIIQNKHHQQNKIYIKKIKEEPTTKAKKKLQKRTKQKISQKQLKIRKKNIQKLMSNTRILPNSAFTTFFGKPAFQNYGYANKTLFLARHKSHSVMPHAGNNYPILNQTHKNALLKAKMLNSQSFVSRKLQITPTIHKQIQKQEQINVKINKPNLIKELYFSNFDFHQHQQILKKYRPRSVQKIKKNKSSSQSINRPILKINKNQKKSIQLAPSSNMKINKQLNFMKYFYQQSNKQGKNKHNFNIQNQQQQQQIQTANRWNNIQKLNMNRYGSLKQLFYP